MNEKAKGVTQEFPTDSTLMEQVGWILEVSEEQLERANELGTAGKFSEIPRKVNEHQRLLELIDINKLAFFYLELGKDLAFPDLRNTISQRWGRLPREFNFDLGKKANEAFGALIVQIGLRINEVIFHKVDPTISRQVDKELSRDISIYNSIIRRFISHCRVWIEKAPSDDQGRKADIINEVLNEVSMPSEKKIAELEQHLSKTKGIAEEVEKARDQVNTLISALSDEAGKQGIAAEAKYFDEEGRAHETVSLLWLIASIVSSLILVSSAVFFYYSFTPSSVDVIDWNQFIPRISALGLQIISLLILVGNFRAERHNAIINKHRANSLATFETMTQSTTTRDVRDAITLTAANAIYAPQDTGFSRRTTPQQMNAADIFGNLVNRNSD